MRAELNTTKRRIALRRLAAGGILAGSGMIGVLQAALAAEPRAGIRSLKGRVSIDGKPAMIGQQVGIGQTIETGADGEVVFVSGEDAFLQRANTRFVMEENDGVAVLRYLSGKILSVFGKGRKRLITPTAAIGIRGTGCYIEAEPERTYFCLCYGAAVVMPIADANKRKSIRTRHHDYPVYISAQRGPLMVAPASVANHDDAELTMLEALVGREPPFHGQGYSKY